MVKDLMKKEEIIDECDDSTKGLKKDKEDMQKILVF